MDKFTFSGENIRYLRIRNNINRKDLADMVGTTRDKIRDYETERSVPPLSVLLAICDEFNIPVDSFYSKLRLEQDPDRTFTDLEYEDMIKPDTQNEQSPGDMPAVSENEDIKKVKAQKEQFYNELGRFNNLLSENDEKKD